MWLAALTGPDANVAADSADLAGLAATQAWLARVPPLADALAGRELARRRRVVDGQALHALAGAFGLVAMLWLVSAAVADDGLPPAMAAALCFATECNKAHGLLA